MNDGLTIKELLGVKLKVNPILPAQSLVLIGESVINDKSVLGVIGIFDMSGKFKSWVLDDHVILEIQGTQESINRLKENMLKKEVL